MPNLPIGLVAATVVDKKDRCPMSPTDNQRAFQEMAERFAREKIVPDYMERKKTGHVDRGLVQEMGNLGLLGPDLPEKYGALANQV